MRWDAASDLQAGAYNAAVRGVHGIVHAASPLDGWNAGDPALVVGPAVAGVTNLLESVRNARDVRRVVQIR